MSTDNRARGLVLAVALIGLLSAGCYTQQMADQRRLDPLEASDLFADGRASRAPVPGTVARGHLHSDELLFSGKVDGEPASVYPFEITLEVLRRGRERYDIYCSPCHDRVGNGNGVVVQRGFRRPPTLHLERLRQAPPGYVFDIVSNGFGSMPSYAAQVPVLDRWAIVAYIRALQLSQFAPDSELQPQDLERLGGRR